MVGIELAENYILHNKHFKWRKDDKPKKEIVNTTLTISFFNDVLNEEK